MKGWVHVRLVPEGLICGCGGLGASVLPMHEQRTSGLAIAGFVTAFFCGLIGLIMSISALGDIKRSHGQLRGDGLAVAGIVVASVMMFAGVMMALAR